MTPDSTLFDLLAALSVLFFVLCFATALMFWRVHLMHSEPFMKKMALRKLTSDCQREGRAIESLLLQRRIDDAYGRARALALQADDSQYYTVLRVQFEAGLNHAQDPDQHHG